jgi:glycosyltransferase involved in cell wall biosynthesis
VTVAQDPNDPEFLDQNDWNPYRLLMSRFVLPRAKRIRVMSEPLLRAITIRHKGLEGKIDVLPRFYDVAALGEVTPSFNLHERYPQFTFIMLLYGRIDRNAHAEIAIDAASHALRQYPSVGVVVAGYGPGVSSLRSYVHAKGLSEKIVFETPRDTDMSSYLKTADMLISSASAHQPDELYIAAAAVGIPVLVTKVGIVETLFENTVSGLVCVPGDLGCLIKGINRYMGDGAFRTNCAGQARMRVLAISGDPVLHATRYKESIEQTLIAMSKDESREDTKIEEATADQVIQPVNS